MKKLDVIEMIVKTRLENVNELTYGAELASKELKAILKDIKELKNYSKF